MYKGMCQLSHQHRSSSNLLVDNLWTTNSVLKTRMTTFLSPRKACLPNYSLDDTSRTGLKIRPKTQARKLQACPHLRASRFPPDAVLNFAFLKLPFCFLTNETLKKSPGVPKFPSTLLCSMTSCLAWARKSHVHETEPSSSGTMVTWHEGRKRRKLLLSAGTTCTCSKLGNFSHCMHPSLRTHPTGQCEWPCKSTMRAKYGKIR